MIVYQIVELKPLFEMILALLKSFMNACVFVQGAAQYS